MFYTFTLTLVADIWNFKKNLKNLQNTTTLNTKILETGVIIIIGTKMVMTHSWLPEEFRERK